MRVASITLAGSLYTVVEARQFLADTLARWSTDAYDLGATQVLSELATNAALHARSPYTVALRLNAGSLLIEVTDGSPRLPVRRHYARDATTGRGLRLVAAFSHSWGATAVAGGKTVWARVEPDGSGVSMFEDFEGHDETPADAASLREHAGACRRST